MYANRVNEDSAMKCDEWQPDTVGGQCTGWCRKPKTRLNRISVLLMDLCISILINKRWYKGVCIKNRLEKAVFIFVVSNRLSCNFLRNRVCAVSFFCAVFGVGW